jgi:hypothetical protein
MALYVCGGRGKHSWQTPQELVAIGERVGFDGSALAKASRLVAKVDSAAVQDGFLAPAQFRDALLAVQAFRHDAANVLHDLFPRPSPARIFSSSLLERLPTQESLSDSKKILPRTGCSSRCVYSTL